MSDEKAEVKITGDNADLVAKMHGASAAVKQATDGMTQEFERVGAVIKNLQLPFLAIGSILAGGELFEKVIESTAAFGSQLEVLSQKTGIEADELSRLKYAADLSHVSSETLDTGLKKLSRSMQDAAAGGITPAAQAFRAMGIAVKDGEGKLRPMEDVLLDVAGKFGEYEDGAAKSALAMNLFGRSGVDVVPFLNKGKEGIQALMNESDRMNATWGKEGVQIAVNYENAMKRVHAATGGLSRDLALALMPALTSLATSLTAGVTNTGAMSAVTEVLGGTMRTLGTIIIGIKYSFEMVWLAGKGFLGMLGSIIGDVAAGIDALVHRNFAGAKAAMSTLSTDMSKTWDATMDSMLVSTQAAGDAIDDLFAKTKDPDPNEKKRNKPAPGLASKGGGDALAQAHEEWDERRAAATEGKDDLLEIEMDFWQQKMDATDRSTKAGAKLYDAYHKQLLASIRQYNADAKAADKTDLQATRDTALEALDVDKQTIEEKRALRQLDAKDAQVLLVANANAAYALKRQSLDEELALADGDLKQQAAIRKQLIALDRAHNKELAGISKQTTAEIAMGWEATFSHITDTIKLSFQGVIQGTQTLGDAMKNMFRNITLSFIAGKAEELKAHAAAELAKRGITTTTVLHHVFSEAAKTAASIAGAAVRLATEVGTALKSMAINSAAAFMGMTAWLASKLGPFAIPVALGATAGAFAVGASLMSAAGGYDIPAGINPMTQLHAQEMVLPAKYADVIRGMAEGGGSGGGGTTVNIQAWDSRDVKQFVMDHSDHFADATARAIENRHTGLHRAIRNNT